MRKALHEIRDPIHVFVRLDSEERSVVDTWAFQRLRQIHQLALTYLLYPGATHRRFEHSLGVMELASRVYDVLVDGRNLHDDVREIVPSSTFGLQYWRRVLRMAALCHDLGHLPFSHAAESQLLPEGWDHERMTIATIRGGELQDIWKELGIHWEHVAKLAVGARKYTRHHPDAKFSDWEAILSEIITGDAFGVDRIDYLLRDSYHAGVAYGRFDHYRLVDTLRILPKAYAESKEPALGIEEGGIHSAESLLLARYLMYTQLYFHHVRRAYDLHLIDFLKALFPEGFPTDLDAYLRLTDTEVTARLLSCARDESGAASLLAKRIVDRQHYRLVYSRNPEDLNVNPEAPYLVYKGACREFGEDDVKFDSARGKGNPTDFPVTTQPDGRVMSSLAMSEVLRSIPSPAADFVLVHPRVRERAEHWLRKNRTAIITPPRED